MSDDITIRTPTVADGPAIWRLVEATGVLDVNSCYAYLLMCDHHGATSVVAEADGDVVGFVTAWRIPARPDTVFVWQVGVDERARGRGLASRLLDAVVAQPANEGVRNLETTITPSNQASRKLFRSFARRHEAPCEVGPGFPAELLGDGHEPEELFRIGPFRSAPTT